DRARALVERRVVLIVLPADEAVEVLEPGAGRPHVERPERTVLEDGHLVALAELRGRVAVQPERLRERRLRVRTEGRVARRGRRELRDASHADGGVVPAAQERGA